MYKNKSDFNSLSENDNKNFRDDTKIGVNRESGNTTFIFLGLNCPCLALVKNYQCHDQV